MDFVNPVAFIKSSRLLFYKGSTYPLKLLIQWRSNRKWCLSTFHLGKSALKCPQLKTLPRFSDKINHLKFWHKTGHRICGNLKFTLNKCHIFFIILIWVLQPIKIIKLILSQVNHKVGQKQEKTSRKNTWPPASRTWLISHVTRARLEIFIISEWYAFILSI